MSDGVGAGTAGTMAGGYSPLRIAVRCRGQISVLLRAGLMCQLCRAGSRPRFNRTAPATLYGFAAGGGKATELAISHFPPCLTKVLM